MTTTPAEYYPAPPDTEPMRDYGDNQDAAYLGHPPGDEGRGVPALGSVLRRSQLSDLPKVRHLVRGVLSQPAAVLLVGAYGTGKSVLVHGLAASVATGQRWLGQDVERRRTLVVIGEGAYGLDDRITAWESTWNRGQPIDDHDLVFVIKPGSLRQTNTWRQLIEYATAGGFGFVILDTFSSLAPDADEVKDSPLVMRHLSDLASAIDGTALLVHHPGWGDNGRARGGYQLEANADEVLVLTGVAGEPLVSLKRKKVKDGPAGATIWLRRRAREPSVIFEWAEARDLEVPLAQRILAVLISCADVGATGPQVMAECKVDDDSRSGFYAALKKLRNKAHVKTTGSGRSLRYYAADHAPGDAQ